MIGWKFWNCWNWSHTKLDNPLIYRASKIRYSLFKLPSLVNPAPWKEWMGKLINGILKPTWGRWRRRWAAPPGWRCRPLPSESRQPGLRKGLLGSRSSTSPEKSLLKASITVEVSSSCWCLGRASITWNKEILKQFLTNLAQRLELALWEPSSKPSSYGSPHSKTQGSKGESTWVTFGSLLSNCQAHLTPWQHQL